MPPLARCPRNAFLPGMATPPSSSVSTAKASLLVSLLEELGVTHLLTVPDNTSAPVLAAMENRGREPRESGREAARESDQPKPIRLLYATREGEAIGIASGLWLGGAVPAVMIQNTGLLEAGDGLRGTAARMGTPLLLLVTCRGYEKARGRGMNPSEGRVDRDILVRSDLDSVAHMTEATLRAWGIPFVVLRDSSDLEPVRKAFFRARDEERPVAVLVDTSFK